MKAQREVIIKPKATDRKHFHVEMKIKSTENRMIQGFASTRFPDRSNEVVDPKALLAAMDLFMQNPVVLLDHDQCTPIGKVVDYAVSQDGLQITANIISGTEDADEAWVEIQQGVRRAFSIGFIPRVIDYSAENPVISELELLEVSVVTIPCNRESLFSILKAFELGSDIIEKAVPKMGWDKTKADLLSIRSVILANASGLPLEEKIFVESILKELQNAFQEDSSSVKLKIENECLELELENEKLLSELRSFI